MLELKDYQHRALDALTDFFDECSRGRFPHQAFGLAQARHGAGDRDYVAIRQNDLAAAPYVCLRVPTGGGKTLMACHAAGAAMRRLLRADRAVVLWLVPGNAILEQTVAALRDARHPYRAALENACGTALEILTVAEALAVSRARADGATLVIVATLQSFRVEDKTGRKVYERDGALAEHFLNLPTELAADLTPDADGRPLPSLANVLRLRRPVVIVDEAHNARTELSFETLGGLRPSCVIEFTATPAREKNPSNVLHAVSAWELKAAEMIKLPLRVVTRDSSQRDELLADALRTRSDLEKLAVDEAAETGAHVRPILLVQAESVEDCEPLRERLASEFQAPREWVRIATGKQDDLPSGDELRSPKCPVRVVITVQKLREGWDCPFAYVLCSLRATRSTTAIEQIVGRVLRLPGASRKRRAELNCAYVFSVSPNINEVLSELRDALVENGFSPFEAARSLSSAPAVFPLGAQPQRLAFAAGEADLSGAAAVGERSGGKIIVDAQRGELTIFVPLDAEETAALANCAKTPEARRRIVAAVETVREAERAAGGAGGESGRRVATGWERQLEFKVPLLSVREEGRLLEFEKTHLLEYPWRLGEKDATLPANYNPLERPRVETGALDVSAGAAGVLVVGETAGEARNDFVEALHQRTASLALREEWMLEMLIGWLDRQIPHADIAMGESGAFLLKALRGLMARCGADVDALARDRFRLREQIAGIIEAHRQRESAAAFRNYLLPASALEVSDENALNFGAREYEPGWLYDGGFVFQKHYYGKPGELREKRSDGGLTEEFLCARHIDAHPAVEWWVRNLARRIGAFSLLLPDARFWPDFVCKLRDGRTLVVEYKGAHLMENPDSQLKRAVGAVWESRSAGRCLFVMPTKRDFGEIDAKLAG